MLREMVKATGKVNYKLFDKDGKIKEEHTYHNLVVTVGKNFLAAWLAASSQANGFMENVGLGTGVTAANVSDVDLETPLATRVVGALTSSTNVYQNVATFNAGVNTGAITEAALFSASSGGTLFARQVFAVINKGAGDSLQVTWQITFS